MSKEDTLLGELIAALLLPSVASENNSSEYLNKFK